MGLESFSTSDVSGESGGRVSGRYSDQELLDSLKEFYKEHGNFTISEYKNQVSTPSYSTIKRRFGTFNKAKIKAGIEPNESGGEYIRLTDSMQSASESKSFIVGCLLTDGWIHTGESNHVGFQVKDKELAKKFGIALSDWANISWDGFNSGKTEMEARGPIEVKGGEDNWRIKKGTHVAEHLDSYTGMSSDQLIGEFENYKKTLLEAIWDAEGSISEDGSIRFANSDKQILRLYIELVTDVVGIEFDDEWEWSTEKLKHRQYGDFNVSTKVSDSDVRNITFSTSYNREFANSIDSNVDRKSERLEQWD